MRRYLAPGPRATTTTRCASTDTRRSIRKHRSHDAEIDFRASNAAEGGNSAVNSTDPFAAFEVDASIPSNGESDFLKELEIFNQGVLPVKKKKATPKAPRHIEVDGEPTVIRKIPGNYKTENFAGRIQAKSERTGAAERWTAMRDEGHKPREHIPPHLDEKYRYLTTRDKYMYDRESSGLASMIEFARRKQTEWQAQQPSPLPPKPSFPPDPIHETPEMREISYTPPTSLPTPRQRERLLMSPLVVPIPSFWTEKAYKPKPRMEPKEWKDDKTYKLKPRTTDPRNWTPFQRKLYRNPYAETLSSPVRRCLVMNFVRLPRDLLISFEHMTNPEDGRTWILPRELTRPLSDAELRMRVPNELSKGSSASDVADQRSARDAHERYHAQATNKFENRKTGRFYILASKKLIDHVTKKVPDSEALPAPERHDANKRPAPNPYFGKWQVMNHLARLPGQERADGEWKSNMGQFILDLMRKRVTALIYKNLFKPQKDVQYRPHWDDIVRQKQIGCVLWLGREELTPRSTSPRWQEEMSWGPSQYTTITNPPFWTKKLPVFNLLRLLGVPNVTRIRDKGPPVDKKDYIVVRDKPDAMEIRMWLWRIENYMATYEGDKGDLGRWEPRDDEDDAGEDVEFETVYVPEGGVEEDMHSEETGTRVPKENTRRPRFSTNGLQEALATAPTGKGRREPHPKRYGLSSNRYVDRQGPDGW